MAMLALLPGHSRTVRPAGRTTLVARLYDLSEENVAAIFEGDSTFLDQQRPKLLGTLSSSALLEEDNANGMLPPRLERDAAVLQYMYVDEPKCVGCRSCTQVARSTFRMEDDFGAARAFQQLADEPEVIEEARDCCPVDCIHLVSFAELKVLEEHRQGQLDSGAMAAAQGAGKLAARAEGRDGAPSWRAPLRAPLARARLDQLGGLEEPGTELGDSGNLPQGKSSAGRRSRACTQTTSISYTVLVVWLLVLCMRHHI